MVEGCEFTYNGHDRIGKPEIIGGHVGKVLDLSHDVVPQETHEASVHRRQPVDIGCVVHLKQGLKCREHSLIGRDPLGKGALHGDGVVA